MFCGGLGCFHGPHFVLGTKLAPGKERLVCIHA